MSLIICAFLYAICSLTFAVTPLVKTPLGEVNGIYETSYDGKIYSAFYGVPYAKPPVGDFRFENPQPLPAWEGVWDASFKEITCAQIDHVVKPAGGIYRGEEDCLYLNIFVPRMTPSNQDLLDVIVYIHGGAFMYGSNRIGARFLMDRDVVLVSINYRLGTLGFLSTEDEVLPGNLGLRDQVEALKWIQENIQSFGGNPDSVTITGLSAGGSSVHFHYFSPIAKGLFHRGISISGTVLGPSKIQENALQKTKKVALALGCEDEDTMLIINCMKQKPVEKVVEAVRVLRPWVYYPYSPIGVTIEKSKEDIYLPDHPIALLSRKEFSDLPWMNTFTSEEGLYPGLEFITDSNYLEEMETKWDTLAPQVFDYNHTVSKAKMDEVSQAIKKEYLKGQPLQKDTYMDFIAILSDRMFVNCAEEASKLQAYFSKSDVYNYYFSYPGDGIDSAGTNWIGKHTPYGVGHGDDACFVFSNIKKPHDTLSESDEKMMNIFLDVWVSFAKSGKPIVENVEWIPVSKDFSGPLEHLHIRLPDDITMEDAYSIDRHRKFWKSLPIMENLKLYPEVIPHHQHQEL